MNGQRKLLIAAVLAISGAAHAQTNTGSILCASCNSEGDLANAAYDWGVNHPSTALTVLAVVSQSVPITGYFRVRLVKEPGAPPYIEVDDVTPNAQAAGMTPCPTTNAAECANWNVAMLDNRLFARSSNKYEHPITVPYTQTYIDSTISVYIENNLLRFDPQGETGLSWLHFLSAGGWPPT
jgi:hypothetical protein